MGIITPPPIPPEDGPANAPVTLTVTYYQQLAAHLSDIFDAITAIIPRDNTQLIDRSSGFVRTHLNVPVKFLATTVASVEQLPELQSINKLDALKGRNMLQLLDAFRPIRDKVLAFLEDFESVLDAAQATLSVQALDTYDVAKSLARDGSNPTLTVWVANMQRDLGRSGPRKKKPQFPEVIEVSPATLLPESPDSAASKDTEPRGHAARV